MLFALALATALALPPAHGGFDYQLGGAYPPSPGVTVVTRDRSDAPASGIYSICYVNAYQTQPDADAWWRAEHSPLLLRDAHGHEVTDPGWPGEILLDTRSRTTRSALARIVGDWIADCGRRGFQAVEPDNLDSWTRSRALLTMAGNVALARLLVAQAHSAGLAIAQKNAVELAGSRRSIGFDFAVSEECQVYDECGAYLAAYGREVYEIEYSDNG